MQISVISQLWSCVQTKGVVIDQWHKTILLCLHAHLSNFCVFIVNCKLWQLQEFCLHVMYS